MFLFSKRDFCTVEFHLLFCGNDCWGVMGISIYILNIPQSNSSARISLFHFPMLGMTTSLWVRLYSCMFSNPHALHHHGYCSAILCPNTELQLFIKMVRQYCSYLSNRGQHTVVISLCLHSKSMCTLKHDTLVVVGRVIPKPRALIQSCPPSAAVAASTLLGRLSTTFWNLSGCRDLRWAISSSSVHLFDFTVVHGLGFAHSLADDFKGSSLVGCDTLVICA